jgi:hypothetical protein
MEEGYPASAATQHKLSTKWVLWFDYPVKGFAIFFFSFFFFLFLSFHPSSSSSKEANRVGKQSPKGLARSNLVVCETQ